MELDIFTGFYQKDNNKLLNFINFKHMGSHYIETVYKSSFIKTPYFFI